MHNTEDQPKPSQGLSDRNQLQTEERWRDEERCSWSCEFKKMDTEDSGWLTKTKDFGKQRKLWHLKHILREHYLSTHWEVDWPKGHKTGGADIGQVYMLAQILRAAREHFKDVKTNRKDRRVKKAKQGLKTPLSNVSSPRLSTDGEFLHTNLQTDWQTGGT